MRTHWKSAVLSAMLMSLMGSWGVAMGLKTPFADVTVDHLEIGKTYSLKDRLNFPLRVTNTSEALVDLQVQVLVPRSDSLSKGYEAIPDPSWVRLQKSSFKAVPPGQDAVTDVVISLPPDEKLLGRRFQVFLWTRTMMPGAVGVGLNSRLRFSVSSTRIGGAELKKKSGGSKAKP